MKPKVGPPEMSSETVRVAMILPIFKGGLGEMVITAVGGVVSITKVDPEVIVVPRFPEPSRAEKLKVAVPSPVDVLIRKLPLQVVPEPPRDIPIADFPWGAKLRPGASGTLSDVTTVTVTVPAFTGDRGEMEIEAVGPLLSASELTVKVLLNMLLK